MWQQLIFCFLLIGSSYQFTQAEVDVNSHNQADMIWSYLQLRPDDVYITENDITLVTDIATNYYGSDSYAPLIFDANPSLEYDENFRILNAGVEITLPSVIRCTEFLPLDCIEKSHIVTGSPLTINVVPKTVTPADPVDTIGSRRLQQATDIDYLSFEDLPQPLMERVRDISPLDLKIDIVNQMKVALWPRDGGASSFIRAGNQISYTRKVSPYDVTSYHFSLTTIFNQIFFVEVSVALAPMPHFPFFSPGEDAYIRVRVTNTTNSIYVKTYYTSPKINPTQGEINLLTGTGQDQPNLNITLSIDTQWGKNTARLVLEQYYGDAALGGFNNQLRRISHSDSGFRIEYVNSPKIKNAALFSNSLSNARAAQVWRFIRIRGNEYRILNLNTRQAIGADTTRYNFRMENRTSESSTQVWTLIPKLNTPGSYFVQGMDNLCWTLDNQESSISANVYPLRLLACDATNSKQVFTFPSAPVPSGNAWDWSL